MNILIIGYGKMGREIEKIAISRGHEVVGRIDQASDWGRFDTQNRKADVAIEFSIPSVVVENIRNCFKRSIPIVVGTTAWYDQLESISKECKERNQTLFSATNYSIGVAIFIQVNAFLAKLMSQQDYDVSMTEVHHLQKLDAPSGTAITIAEKIIENHTQMDQWKLVESEECIDRSTLGIRSVRIGEVPGTHTVAYTSEVDVISLTHEAKSRKGFALGAVVAAEFLKGKKGVFGMKDLLQF